MKNLNVVFCMVALVCLSACNSGSSGSSSSPSSPSNMTMILGSTLPVGFSNAGTVCKTDVNSPDASITLSSSNNNIATVNPNTCTFTSRNNNTSSCCDFEVTGVESGPATITATASGYNPASATILITAN